MFKTMIPTFEDRTQLVFFVTAGPSHFMLWSTIATLADDGTLPQILQRKGFEPYRLDIIGNLVVLQDLFPAGPPSPLLEEIIPRAVELARYCDRIEADLSTDDRY